MSCCHGSAPSRSPTTCRSIATTPQPTRFATPCRSAIAATRDRTISGRVRGRSLAARSDLTSTSGPLGGRGDPPDRINFAPRLGLAWDPSGSRRPCCARRTGSPTASRCSSSTSWGRCSAPKASVLFDVRDNSPLSGQFPVNPVLPPIRRSRRWSRSSFPYNPNPDVLDPDRKLPSINTVSAGGQTRSGRRAQEATTSIRAAETCSAPATSIPTMRRPGCGPIRSSTASVSSKAPPTRGITRS